MSERVSEFENEKNNNPADSFCVKCHKIAVKEKIRCSDCQNLYHIGCACDYIKWSTARTCCLKNFSSLPALHKLKKQLKESRKKASFEQFDSLRVGLSDFELSAELSNTMLGNTHNAQSNNAPGSLGDSNMDCENHLAFSFSAMRPSQTLGASPKTPVYTFDQPQPPNTIAPPVTVQTPFLPPKNISQQNAQPQSLTFKSTTVPTSTTTTFPAFSFGQATTSTVFTASTSVTTPSANPIQEEINSQVASFSTLSFDDKLTEMFRSNLTLTKSLECRMQKVEKLVEDYSTMVRGQETRLADLEKTVSQVHIDIGILNDKINSLSTLPHTVESQLYELSISGLPIETTLSDEEIADRVFRRINAIHFASDVYAARRVIPRLNGNVADGTEDNQPSLFSLILKFKTKRIRDEVIRLKIACKDVLAKEIFPELGVNLEKKLYLNEWLSSDKYNLLKQTRAKAKESGYERVWVRNGSIFVRKNAQSDRMAINSVIDLNKMQ